MEDPFNSYTNKIIIKYETERENDENMFVLNINCHCLDINKFIYILYTNLNILYNE